MSNKDLHLQISGMNCQACANRIEKVLNKNQYINNAQVNYASEEAVINFDDSQLNNANLIEIINKTGFSAVEKSDDVFANELNSTAKPWRLILIWLITIPFIISMLGMLFKQHHLMLAIPIQFVLASIVQLFLATPFYKSAYASIKGGLANMDVLVVLGTTSIWLFSTIMYFFSQTPENYIYFEASVMVIAFISLGKFLEHSTKHHSLNSLNNMLKLIPKTAEVYRDGQWDFLPYEQIQLNDTVKAKIGDKICADGVIQSGQAWLNESHLTGESLPLEKTIDDKVLAGSMIEDGSIVYRVLSLGKNTLLGDMIKALSDAQATKAPIARIADQVAGIFVPVVVVIAILTLLVTYLISGDFSQALIHAVSVLVIACPCALGLATPAAIMVGMGVGSKNGIWFKNAAAMETVASIDTVALDKTGTLTNGKPIITDIWLNPDSQFNMQQLWQLVASVEEHSTHPLAISICQQAKQNNISLLPIHNIKNTLGAGLQADIENIGQVKVGNLTFCNLILPENMTSIWQISTLVAVSVNDIAVGAFALSDSLKQDSKQAIQQLLSKKISPYIFSGDKQSVVQFMAAELNIPSNHAIGEMTPRDKAAAIIDLIKQNKKVAMVGDGINDAAALASATVGLAMGNGADITEQTADITLLHHSVTDVVNTLTIGQATMKNIKENLFFAFIYNVIGIPLAAFGFLTPIIAGAAMALSSISVLLNALRLKRIKLEK